MPAAPAPAMLTGVGLGVRPEKYQPSACPVVHVDSSRIGSRSGYRDMQHGGRSIAAPRHATVPARRGPAIPPNGEIVRRQSCAISARRWLIAARASRQFVFRSASAPSPAAAPSARGGLPPGDHGGELGTQFVHAFAGDLCRAHLARAVGVSSARAAGIAAAGLLQCARRRPGSARVARRQLRRPQAHPWVLLFVDSYHFLVISKSFLSSSPSSSSG